MKTAMISMKIDPKVKKEAQLVADELGLSLSAIINATLTNLVRTKTVSYSVFEPTPLLKKAIISARSDRKKIKRAPFTTAQEMMTSLRA